MIVFLHPEEFGFVKRLESSWSMVRDEFKELPESDFVDWPEPHVAKGKWRVFGLYAVGTCLQKNCARCPGTTKLVESVPGMVMAGFSILSPGTRLLPHLGYTPTVWRCHLGLKVNHDACLTVGGEKRVWQEGRCLIFDDTFEHEARNDGMSDRVVLLIDFLRPGAQFDPEIDENTWQFIRSQCEVNSLDRPERPH